MPMDIRDKISLGHKDVIQLNFIKPAGPYYFRRHFRAGMRSHVLQILRNDDIIKEKKGIKIDGIRFFPKAEPQKMLRIFRTRFKSLEEAEKELERFNMILKYLGAESVAKSNEFLVDYKFDGHYETLLCGVQEYVKGEILDPWSPLNQSQYHLYLKSIFHRLNTTKDQTFAAWFKRLNKNAGQFIVRVKRLINDANHIPDLAGIGNILISESGHIKLVDINNISAISFGSAVSLDDRGYPVCDKSVEALALLEDKFSLRLHDPEEILYRHLLKPDRIKKVKKAEQAFFESLIKEPTLAVRINGYPSALD